MVDLEIIFGKSDAVIWMEMVEWNIAFTSTHTAAELACDVDVRGFLSHS
jgi:hypothetical protein